MLGAYLHIPFCESKCAYCNFYSFKANEYIYEQYTNTLCSHLTACKGYSFSADTLYLGGGTPSVLGGKRIHKIVKTAKECLNISDGQITVEINPAFNIKEDLLEMKAAGVNRLSFGVQTAIEKELKALNRRHVNSDVLRSVNDAKEIGFKDISLDLMIGIPHQTMNSLKESLDFLLSLSPTHISCYMLKVEKGTPFGNTSLEKLNLPDEDTVCDMYLFVSDYLKKFGFNHYEISNFALDGFESKHNNKYWNSEEYLGLGPAAHSYLNGKRFYFKDDLDEYITSPTPIFDGIGGNLEEYIMLRLRLSKGVIFDELEKIYNTKIPNKLLEKAKSLMKFGLVEVDEKHVSLTPKGFLVSNSIISDFIECI